MKCFGITDKGLKRPSNQDSYVIAYNEVGDVFAMVCDGIGGGRGGDVASHIAVRFFSEVFSRTIGFKSQADVKAWLTKYIDICNGYIFEAGNKNPALKGMGTTLSGVIVCRAGKFIVNIGDSRVYAFKKDAYFKQVTMDHTLVQDMLNHGELTVEQAVNFPKKNVLTNALGVWNNVKCDIEAFDQPTDGFLICSDGLHGYIEKEIIQDIVLDEEMDPCLRVRRLLQVALQAGGYDNVTALILDLEGDETHE